MSIGAKIYTPCGRGVITGWIAGQPGWSCERYVWVKLFGMKRPHLFAASEIYTRPPMMGQI